MNLPSLLCFQITLSGAFVTRLVPPIFPGKNLSRILLAYCYQFLLNCMSEKCLSEFWDASTCVGEVWLFGNPWIEKFIYCHQYNSISPQCSHILVESTKPLKLQLVLWTSVSMPKPHAFLSLDTALPFNQVMVLFSLSPCHKKCLGIVFLKHPRYWRSVTLVLYCLQNIEIYYLNYRCQES